MSNTRNVIGVYRNMMRLAKNMRPEVKKRETLLLIRKEFRSNAAEEDAGRVATLLEKASSSLGYLKIITPRTAVPDKQAGHTRIVRPCAACPEAYEDGLTPALRTLIHSLCLSDLETFRRRTKEADRWI